MSDDIPRTDPWQDDSADDSFDDLDDEAIEGAYPVYSSDQEWDDETDEFLPEQESDAADDVDTSFYEPPEPPVTDSELEPEEPPNDGGGWFRANWWRLLIVVILVALIIFLLVRACGGNNEKSTATPIPTPSRAALATFTPTPELLPTTELNSGGSMESPTGGENAPPAEATSQPTEPPPPTTAPPAGDKFAVGDVVVVTGTGKDRLSFREGPGTKYDIIRLVRDGTQLTVVGGPKEADGYTWWQLKTKKGRVGWAVEDYLEPVQ